MVLSSFFVICPFRANIMLEKQTNMPENLENIDTVISQKEYISQLLEEKSEVKRLEAVSSGDVVACSSCVSCGKFTRSVSTQKSDEEN